ncbi:2-aminoethylphosphonate aminotransferase [Bacillus taeanensis]|uniref:2-aminoethylphosphonate--pyruvate transaminase n=1 Tax=Bacillus taeanensis TaxID=273032 RepID=A0A366Y0R1_9BACI|nr:2-aminoethylphosphonate--pyruvate transaminase [Bacillus taeanensis]RBW69993.1 2-aminoethylphosphonate--pyruvate transaminase [Bacillus taeanensis]
MVKAAVILAAGLGSRLGKRTKEKPKGFLEIGDKTLIEHSILHLLSSGIERIYIGTGYLKEFYEELALRYKEITCVTNEQYDVTGSMYTLFQFKNYVKEDFLLLESDLLYDQAALTILQYHHYPDVLLASELTDTNDEVFIEVDDKNQLVNMEKDQNRLFNIYGELIGITKLSYGTFQALCYFADKELQKNKKLDYERALIELCSEKPIAVHKVKELAWCEIDNEVHLKRAVETVYPQIKENMKDRVIEKKILLNPGPAATSNTVKYAQVVPDICPREKEFGAVMKWTAEELTSIVGNRADYTTILFGGSGTAAVEAMISSIVDQDTLLIINNGAYGKRMCQIADAYGIHYIEYKSKQDHPLSLKKLEAIIKKRWPKISHVAVVHHETTTGLLNDIEAIGSLCRCYDVELLVDAMSSFAAVPIAMERMNIHYLAASSNKNLQGMAGVSFVIANKKCLEQLKNIKARSYYLNLYEQYEYFKKTGQMRFTPPVQTLYAMKQAVVEAKKEGIVNRYNRYKKLWNLLIKGITELGLNHIVKEEHHAKLITAIIEPSHKRYHFNELHDYLYERGVTIYPGKLADLNTFRIANIGELEETEIELFLYHLKQYLEKLDLLNN